MKRYALIPIALMTLAVGVLIRPPIADAQDVTALSPSFTLSSASAGGRFAESAAPGGQVLGMWANSTATTTMTTPATSRLTLRLRGDNCDGLPVVSLTVDGRLIGRATIPSATWADLPVALPLAAGRHTVAIGFTNDFRRAGCDRNLYIGSVTATAAPVTTTTRPPVTTTTRPPVTTTTKPPATTTTRPPTTTTRPPVTTTTRPPVTTTTPPVTTTTPPVTTTTPPTTTTTPPVNGGQCGVNRYLATFYNNLNATGTPVATKCEYAVGRDWGNASPAPGVNAGNFSVVYTGSINFPVSGTYNVNAQTGFVGVLAKIDGNTIINYWPNQTWGRYHATANVTAGIHTVSVSVSNPTRNGHEHFSITPTGTSPASNNGNYFAANSYINTPVPANAVVHPNSNYWRDLVANDSRNNGIQVNSYLWSTPIYKAPPGTPTRSIRITNSNKTITIPYTTAMRVTSDDDAHLSVIDETNGCLYEFQTFNPGNMTAIAQATYHAYTGSGAHASGPAHSGGELAYVQGTITPQDVSSGVIDHALRLALPNNSPEYVYPGTRSDGTTAGGVPEGMRIQLDPTLNVDAMGLSPFQKMVAKALQKYGGYNSDHAANFVINTQSTIDGSRYGVSLDPMPKSILSKLRYLAPSVTSTDVQMGTASDTTCAQAR